LLLRLCSKPNDLALIEPAKSLPHPNNRRLAVGLRPSPPGLEQRNGRFCLQAR
jgi:hypothetical protein